VGVEVRGFEPLASSVRVGSDLDLDLDRAELERLRWYLEDYLEYPIDPAPKIAAQVAQRLVELGRDLFGQVFQVREATRLWDRAEPGQDQRSADGRPSRDHRASLR
jgi:hypothetical protein